MAAKKYNDFGTGIPYEDMMALVRALWSDMIKFCENERLKREAETNKETENVTE